jgi:predicted phosphohydrolase
MPAVKLRATTILSAFEEAQTELVGRSVVLTDGKAATVETVWLDEVHGLRISIRGHYGKWPISIIKFAEGYSSRVPRLTEAVVRENYAVVSEHSGPASCSTHQLAISDQQLSQDGSKLGLELPWRA